MKLIIQIITLSEQFQILKFISTIRTANGRILSDKKNRVTIHQKLLLVLVFYSCILISKYLFFIEQYLRMQKIVELEQFPFKNYDLHDLKLLGQGSYGRVYKSLNNKTGQPVAIKQIRMQVIRNEYLDEALKNQMDLMKQIKAQNIVELLQSKVGNKYAYMVLELCDSDLRKVLQRTYNRKIKQEEAIQIFGGVMNGFRVLVENQTIHRDIKPQNVLIKNGVVKLADFGFARKADLLNLTKYEQYCGTPIYMAPQLLNNQPYSSKCDIWSLGLMLYEMIYGSAPWPIKSVEGYRQAIMKRPLSFPFDVKIGKQTKDFIKRALVIDEDKRMSWEQVFTHPIIKDKVAGQVILTKPVEPKLRLILAKVQTETQRKFIDQNEIYKKYEYLNSFTFQQFETLLKQLNPTITTYEINVIFEACDKNNNKLIQKAQFYEMFCSVNYVSEPEAHREVDQIVNIITARKLDLNQLFEKFDKNKTNALDYNQLKGLILFLAPKYTPYQINLLLKTLDKNNSKLIEKKQFIKVIGEGLVNQKNYIGFMNERANRNLKLLKVHLVNSKLTGQDIMKTYDFNHDSQIDESELQKLLNRIQFIISKEQARDIINMLDKNKSNSINMTELLQFMK